MSQHLPGEGSRTVEAVTVQATGMFWGIRRSFLDYVLRLPDVDIAVGDGAEMLDSGLLVFPLSRSTLDPTADRLSGALDFGGQAVVSGHGGMLRVRLAFPRLEIDGMEATLTVDGGGDGHDASRVTLARLDDCLLERQGAELLWSSTSVTLAAGGVPLFGGQYTAGQGLDPVYVRLLPSD